MRSIKQQLGFDSGFHRARAAVKGELGDLMREAQDEMLRVIELRNAKASGDLETSIEWHVKRTSRGFRATAGPDAKPGSNIAPHAKWVDQPTRPHWPPIQPLERWAREKFGATGSEKTSIAWGTARSIARKGTRGVRFTDAAMRKLKAANITERLEDVIANALFD